MSGDPDVIQETESSNPDVELETEKYSEIEQQMVRCGIKL